MGTTIFDKMTPGFSGIAILTVALQLAACGSLKSVPIAVTTAAGDEQVPPRGFAALDERRGRSRNTRSTNAIENGLGLAGKSLLVDPVVRPFSTLKALIGYTVKSTGGILERIFIEKLRMPGLERRALPPLANAAPMDLDAWERDLDSLLNREPSIGKIGFLVDGEAYFQRLRETIEEAERSVDIRTYIFDNDDFALEFADLLRSRSEEVDIRIMVDGLADLVATRLDSEFMPRDVRLPASISDYLTDGNRIVFRKQSNPWFTGDHAKITVIDREIAFVGGMNIGREYRYEWHDLMMQVEGPVVAQLQSEFDQAWARASALGDFSWLAQSLRQEPIESRGSGYPIRILTTSIHDSELYRVQVEAIRRSRSYIYIQNAYFSDDKILFELARARRRGVDVRVILASSADSGVLNLSNRKAANAMLRNGIRVYVYPGMTHLKAAVYDGWACLGSANFDKLSLQVNREINLATSHEATVKDLLDRVFLPDFEISTELHEPGPIGMRHHLAEIVADELL